MKLTENFFLTNRDVLEKRKITSDADDRFPIVYTLSYTRTCMML